MPASRRSIRTARPLAVLAALSLTGAGLALPAQADEGESQTAPMRADVDGVFLSEVHFLGPDSADFIEIGAEPGTDVSGWTVGTVTRGGNPHTGAHVVTLEAGTEIPDNGVLDVGVPITNSTSGGWGSSAFIVTDDDEIAAFYTIGTCSDHQACDEDTGGIIAGTSTNLPEVLRGEIATPTNVIPPSSSFSLQWTDG